MRSILSLVSIFGIATASSAQIKTIERPHKEIQVSGYPTDIKLSADGTRLAAVTDDGKAYVWEFPDCKVVMEVKSFGKDARVALSADGKWFAAPSKDGKAVNIYNTTNKTVAHAVKNKLGAGGTMQFNSKATLLYLNQRDAEEQGAYVYDLASRYRKLLHSGLPVDTVLDEINKREYFFILRTQSFTSGASGGGYDRSIWGTRTLIQRDTKTGKLADVDKLDQGSTEPKVINSDRLVCSPDGKVMLFGNKIRAPENLKIGEHDLRNFGGASFTPDNRFLACSKFSRVYLLDLEQPSTPVIFGGHVARDDAFGHIAPPVTPDGGFIIGPGLTESIRIWDLKAALKK